MKINCGPTWQEKRDALRRWHPWFAWRPVRIGSHDCRWMETIERRFVHFSGFFTDQVIEYRPLNGGDA